MIKIKIILGLVITLSILAVIYRQSIKLVPPPPPIDEFTDTAFELVTVTGKVVKEPVPPELELGDYWYWIYFDELYYLADNASGQPKFVDKLEVTASPGFDIDSILNRHVKITGKSTWGYAESNIIEIVSAEEI